MVEVRTEHTRRRHEEPNVHVDEAQLRNEVIVRFRIRITCDSSKLVQSPHAKQTACYSLA